MLSLNIANVFMLKKCTEYVEGENDERAAMRNVLSVMTCLVVYVPSLVSITLSLVGVHSTTLCSVSTFMLLVASVVNPYVQCFRNPTLRKVLRHMVRRRRRDMNEVDESDVTMSDMDGELSQDMEMEAV